MSLLPECSLSMPEFLTGPLDELLFPTLSYPTGLPANIYAVEKVKRTEFLVSFKFKQISIQMINDLT